MAWSAPLLFGERRQATGEWRIGSASRDTRIASSKTSAAKAGELIWALRPDEAGPFQSKPKLLRRNTDTSLCFVFYSPSGILL